LCTEEDLKGTISSSGSDMFVLFRQRYTQSMASLAFVANYSTGCGGNLVASDQLQTLESLQDFFLPDCSWAVRASDPSQPECARDAL